jgi:hypothetical protein
MIFCIHLFREVYRLSSTCCGDEPKKIQKRTISKVEIALNSSYYAHKFIITQYIL